MGFFNKNNISKDDYETLSKRITDLHHTILTINKRIDGLELENHDLRNKVLRKIQIPKETEENITENRKVFKPGMQYF